MNSELRVDTQVDTRKPYRTPTLTVYGNVETTTRTVNMGAVNDGMTNKTH